jgi:choline dehydrogenase-like flavoprotein
MPPTSQGAVCSPLEAERTSWDAIVVGTGVGGATLGLTLAQAGKRVLFVEKGRDLAAPDTAAIRGRPAEADPAFRGAATRERRDLLARAGRATDELLDVAKGRLVLPEIGCGTGGSSALYGMVLERLFASDFEPRARHPDAADSTLPEAWPVGYEELRPWYERAERLYRVRGGPDPLRTDGAAALLPPAAIGRGATALLDGLAERGLHPYRLHLACESVDGCTHCQGYLCPRACKNDADRVALRPAIREHGAVLLTGCDALSLVADHRRVQAVRCQTDGARVTLRGRIVALAAGALGSAALLLSSRSALWERGLANGSGLIGRNLMRHGIDLWALVGGPRLDHPGDAKAIAFNDLYDDARGKLGTVQSFGVPPPLEYLRNQRSPVWRLAGPFGGALWRRYATVPLLATILEDLPYAANRIELEGSTSGRWRLRYREGRSEVRRRQRFRSRLRPMLRGLGAVLVSRGDAPKALGHVCGTCRFGDDPRTSVVDRTNRAHELDNLYVVDASFFPSSGGINPALTIAANALRVGALLGSQL